MIQTNKRSVEQNLYRWGLLLLPVLIILFILYHINLFIPTRILPPCMFHLLTGYSCPGCGCTRAVQSLLAGDLFSSLCYHPLILYCTLFYLCFMLSLSLIHICTNLFGQSSQPSATRMYLLYLLLVLLCFDEYSNSAYPNANIA